MAQSRKAMKRFLGLIVLAVVTFLYASCTGNVVYDHYNHTTTSGWDKSDTLTYNVPKLALTKRYVTTLGLRVSNSYPFQNLTLIVDQTVYPGGKTISDTLNCTLFDRKGTVKGSGISYYQYHFRVSERLLQAGDSLHITVRHNMRREVMPGIADVGIMINKF